ncbi:MAG: hypothetical protein KDD69_15320 [Bdellovibrionales bacterium]|nr:hypothetical protein [Bdellovibrionales bacterium]
MLHLLSRFEEVLASPPAHYEPAAGSVATNALIPLGLSREQRVVYGARFGRGGCRVSLIAGCHSDEPVGPRFLRHLVRYLQDLPTGDELLTRFEWWIVPDANPDGAARNRPWQHPEAEVYDLCEYLQHSIRELPGDDVEFGFPRGQNDTGARPENRCLFRWWGEARGVFHVHGSLHGMGFAAGPWFLIDSAWVERTSELRTHCREAVERLHYQLHDVERKGEKGFVRIERGFATRPNSRAMAEHFLTQGLPEVAAKFRPSSMEVVRALGGDPFTFVTENPLFITPGVGRELGPPDLAAERWRRLTQRWREELLAGCRAEAVADEAARAGLRPMPVRDQMYLQCALLEAALGAALARQ